MDVNFSINQYDCDGDSFDKCVLIHIDNRTILRFSDLRELEEFKQKINDCIKEIKGNH